jgi:two-component system response regulator AtoC
MNTATILIAEDEATAREALASLIAAEGFHVITAAKGTEAISRILRERPAVALLDIRMPEMDGLTVLKQARGEGSRTAFIVMTAFGDSNTAIEAMKLGAFDYLTKPVIFEDVLRLIRRACRPAGFPRPAAVEGVTAPIMVGRSAAMQPVYKLIGQVAASDATVLVRGESGTGKELVVDAIHVNSSRAQGPLLKVNCAAIPDELLESELFGHERGAFTNATGLRIGRFEAAAGGTLFLDEIGELSPALQAKLLRAVQDRSIVRLGSNAPIRTDIRLITATSRDLEAEMAAGRFREDLYYRLNVVSIQLPPLRERREDLPALVEHFLRRTGKALSITPAALNRLCQEDWPGNVRQLENTIERAAVTARGGVIDEEDIVVSARANPPSCAWADLAPLANAWKSNIAALERAMIRRALELTHGHKSKAAALLGIHRRLLYEKLREHGIE